jgi:membrane-bound inhibitor of C-type lysozyme
MKKTAFILLISATGLFSCAGVQEKPSGNEMNRVLFNCDNGEQVEMRFFPARDMAVLVRNGKSIELKQQPSGSGFIYTNGPNTVRGKGREIMIEIGRMVPIRCAAV